MTVAPTRILPVRDNSGDARLIRLMLAEGGLRSYAVIPVTRVAGALERITTEPFDVILDLQLRDERGPQTLQRVCHAAPTIAVLLLTGPGNCLGSVLVTPAERALAPQLDLSKQSPGDGTLRDGSSDTRSCTPKKVLRVEPKCNSKETLIKSS